MPQPKKKKDDPVEDGVLFRTKYIGPGAAPSGTPIRLEYKDLSVQRLLQLKAWFGEDYGIPNQLIRLIILNEGAAMMALVWIGLQKAGRAVGDARELDFNTYEHFEALEDVQPKAGEKVPPTSDTETTDSTDS